MSSVFHNATCHSRVRAFLSPQSLTGCRRLVCCPIFNQKLSADTYRTHWLQRIRAITLANGEYPRGDRGSY